MNKGKATFILSATAFMALACPMSRAQQPLLLAASSSVGVELPDAPLPTDEASGQTTGQASSSQASTGQAGPKTAGQTQSTGGYVQGQQTKRILGIIPNFRSVSADQKLPPQSTNEKFMTAFQDSFDYSSFIFVGVQAGIAQASKSYPEFHQGAAGYARYYWHTFADQADENAWVEFILPAALHQDSRYYTLGHGGLVKRGAYSFSRVLITRKDSGGETFNASEIVGAGTASAISSLYYPSDDRDWTKVGQRWLTSVIIDGATFTFKEFWPDINDHLFHQKD